MSVVQEKKRLTLNDVAHYAGVSRSTASLVVRGSGKITKETSEKVHRAMHEIGYVYDRMAANMRSQTSNTVGLIITDVGNPFFTDFLKGVHTAIENAGYTAFLGTTYDSEEKQRELITRMREHRVAGLILCPVSTISQESLRLINELDIPTVVAVREYKEIVHDYVGIDYVAGAELAINHLIARGHETIAFVGGASSAIAWQKRFEGYALALQKANLPLDDEIIVETAITREGGKLAVGKIFMSSKRPTAIFTFNDLVGQGVMIGLQEIGVEVGKDIAVVGFDNTAESAWYSPPLTTISAYPIKLGEHAAQLLQNRIANPTKEQQKMIFQPEIVVRESS